MPPLALHQNDTQDVDINRVHEVCAEDLGKCNAEPAFKFPLNLSTLDC